METSNQVEVKVKLAARIFLVRCNVNEPVSALQATVAKQCGVPAARQKLLMGQRPLHLTPDATLTSLGVQAGARITLLESDAPLASSLSSSSSSHSATAAAVAGAPPLSPSSGRPRATLASVMARARARRQARSTPGGVGLAILVDTDQTECAELEALPAEVLLYILSFLGPQPLLRCQLVCKTLYLLASDDQLWHEMYQRRWLTCPAEPPPGSTWKREVFVRMFAAQNMISQQYTSRIVSSDQYARLAMNAWPLVTTIATATNSLAMVDVETGRTVRTLSGHDAHAPITCFHVASDRLLISGDARGNLVLWDCAREQCALPWSKHSNEMAGGYRMFTQPHAGGVAVTTVRSDPAFHWMVAGSSGGQLKRVDLQTTLVTADIASPDDHHNEGVRCIELVDESTVMVADGVGAVDVRDLRMAALACVHHMDVKAPVYSLSFQPEMHMTMAGLQGATVELDMRMFWESRRAPVASDGAVWFDESIVVAAQANSAVHVLDYQTFRPLASLSCSSRWGGGATGVVCDPQRRRIVCATAIGLRVFDFDGSDPEVRRQGRQRAATAATAATAAAADGSAAAMHHMMADAGEHDEDDDDDADDSDHSEF